jgi:tRNA(Ile)-lysidine synthase
MPQPPSLPERLPLLLQDLPPRWAHFCLGVERFLQETGLDLEGKCLLVAVSGGADSTALLLVLHWLTPRLGCRLWAAHLDHGLRPESPEDAAFAGALCERLGLPCLAGAVDVAQAARSRGVGIEEAGREERYAFLERARREAHADLVAAGHHLNDLAEDQVMRQLRGTGWPALAGMEALDRGRRLLRPLLLTPKRDLEELLREVGVAWREDSSNRDPAFLRNRVRSSILPALKRENPNYLEAVASLWRQGRLDRAYWDARVDELTGGRAALQKQAAARRVVLGKADLMVAPPALRLRACKAALDSLGPGQALAEALLRLDHAVQRSSEGKVFQFPGGKQARVTPEGVVFTGPEPGAKRS